ncbi:CD81 antigen-like isoform X1 [Girardinichthys multiradiatus]|uniref:CD81 antigen-like isoform X1 n=1 Tax=Girardinichthys multiradiatus TaxID=208333 RepID=UPI001FAB958B|nr:CD81 antigen-like isoform X1 [Girardinichthys multiradiatus]XP_047213746.1 CD81 antigen-like isoform X1 [Girardinichthys multiradiatus]
MALDGCGVVCKYMLIIFNIIFAVVGFAFLGLGLWLRCSENTRGIFTIGEPDSSTFVTGVTVMIALGIVMLIVVLFGDYGACNEKRCALQVFSVLVFLLAIAEFAVGGLAWSNRMEAGLHLGKFYVSLYERYVMSQDPAIGVILTFIQNSLHCCGITGVSVIEIGQQTCPKPSGFFEHIKMDSCPITIVTVFDSRAPLVMGIFIGTGALLIVAVICSGVLSSQIHRVSSSPQYIILSPSTPSLAAPQPYPPHVTVSNNSFPDQDPVVFTPLPAVNIPLAQA